MVGFVSYVQWRKYTCIRLYIGNVNLFEALSPWTHHTIFFAVGNIINIEKCIYIIKI